MGLNYQLGERVSPPDGGGDMVPAGASPWTIPSHPKPEGPPLPLCSPSHMDSWCLATSPGQALLSVSHLKRSITTPYQNHVLGVPCSTTPVPASHPQTLSPRDVSAFVSRPTGTSAHRGTELPAQKALLSETSILDVVWVGVDGLCGGRARPL